MPAIDTLDRISLGGLDQWIRIRSRDATRPVLLILYGGPGLPLFPRIDELGVRAGLEEWFTVVYWEQRGTGKSYSPSIPPESMTIDRFVDDALELTEALRDRFDKEAIALLGESWGTAIGLLAATRAPERFWAYVGTGQIVDVMEGDRRSYEFTLEEARRRENEKAIQSLTALGPPPYAPREAMTQRQWLAQFGGIRHDQAPQGPAHLLLDIVTTSEYSWKDVWQIATNPFFSLEHLIDELYTLDLAKQVPRVDCPVYMLHGRHDALTPGSLARSYYEQLEAPKKEWIWFNQSAHFPAFEEPEKFGRILQTVAGRAPQPTASDTLHYEDKH